MIPIIKAMGAWNETEKRAEARGGAKRFSGGSRAPAPFAGG